MLYGELASAQLKAPTQVNRLLRRRRREHQKASVPARLLAEQPSLSDMKVQQGCNSSDMGIPVTTEEELRRNTVITPEDVLGLQKITKSKSPAFVTGTTGRVVKALQLEGISITHLLLLVYILHYNIPCVWSVSSKNTWIPWTATV